MPDTKDRSLIVFCLMFILILWRAPSLSLYLSHADLGISLAWGRHVVLGKWPFLDFYTHYGPMIAFGSALGIWLSNSVFMELLICAAGYALALTIIFKLASHYVSRFAGLIASLTGLLLLARFYKWYYWLFPMLALYCVYRILQRGSEVPARWVFVCGLVDGIAALYRVDLGMACLAFHLLIVLSWRLCGLSIRIGLKEMAAFAAGLALPLVSWAAILCLKGGLRALIDYLEVTFKATVDTAYAHRLPFPHFSIHNPLSEQSATVIGYLFLVASYAAGIYLGMRTTIRGRSDPRNKGPAMVAAGLIGICVFPQACHRPDSHHLLQVIPPVLVMGPMLIHEYLRGTVFGGTFPQSKALSLTLAFLFLAFGGWAAWGLKKAGGVDLVGWELNPLPRYLELWKGLDPGSRHPVGKFINEVRLRTKPDDSILVAVCATSDRFPQVYFFAERPMSGLITIYLRGRHDTDKYRARNLAAIRKMPPKLVISTADFLDLSPSSSFRKSQPELYRLLRDRYSHVVYGNGRWVILARDAESRGNKPKEADSL